MSPKENHPAVGTLGDDRPRRQPAYGSMSSTTKRPSLNDQAKADREEQGRPSFYWNGPEKVLAMSYLLGVSEAKAETALKLIGWAFSIPDGRVINEYGAFKYAGVSRSTFYRYMPLLEKRGVIEICLDTGSWYYGCAFLNGKWDKALARAKAVHQDRVDEAFAKGADKVADWKQREKAKAQTPRRKIETAQPQAGSPDKQDSSVSLRDRSPSLAETQHRLPERPSIYPLIQILKPDEGAVDLADLEPAKESIEDQQPGSTQRPRPLASEPSGDAAIVGAAHVIESKPENNEPYTDVEYEGNVYRISGHSLTMYGLCRKQGKLPMFFEGRTPIKQAVVV